MNKITNPFTFRFLNRAAVGWAVSCSAFGFFFFVGNYIQTSADDVIISQLQAISLLFSSYTPQESLVKLAN